MCSGSKSSWNRGGAAASRTEEVRAHGRRYTITIANLSILSITPLLAAALPTVRDFEPVIELARA